MRTCARSWAAAAVVVTGLGEAGRAEACGGLFCDGAAQQVIQTGESIVFAVDRPAGTVTAVINIQYSGQASEFAWVLPLQAAPDEITVAPSSAFATIERLTAPRFEARVEQTGICTTPLSYGSNDDSPLFRGPEVQVLSEQQVGPYESVVLDARSPELVRTWLVDRGYAVTDEMIAAVTPYIVKGDALLALRLQKDRSTGDIQPIAITMVGDEICVPIRLTAIAAQADMEITVLVLSNEGRAIPENYYHVTLNLARIDWLSGGANYKQLVSQAANEGEGNAFTTELAGSARIFDGQFHVPSRYDRAALEAATSRSDLVAVLTAQGLMALPEVQAIVNAHIQLGEASFDARAVTAEIWDRVVVPEQRMQALFDRFDDVTRLFTMISPEEMTIDPVFSFSRQLPPVSNVHRATVRVHCGIGESRDSADVEIEIEDTGERFVFTNDPRGSGRRTVDAMPAAVFVDQLATGERIRDNTTRISALLATQDGCGCRTRAGPSGGLGLGALAVIALVLAMRSTGRRQGR